MKHVLDHFTQPGRIRISGTPGGMDARLVGELAKSGRDVLFIARDDVAGARLDEALQFFAPGVERIDFPSWDCLPYDRVSPNATIVSQRIHALTQLLSKSEGQGRVIVASVSAFLQRVPPRDAFKGSTLIIRPGQTITSDALDTYLVEHGYHNAQTVMEPGEFAKRGGLVDIFPTGALEPVRLDFFGDEVESLRRFDPASQRTIGDVEELALHPVSEVPLNEDAISRFRTGYRALFGAVTKADPLYEAVSEGRRHIGMEHWLPLFYDGRLETILDYMPGAIVLLDHQASEAMEARLDLINEYYQARKSMLGGPKGTKVGAQSSDAPPYKPVPPERLYLGAQDIPQVLKPFAAADLDPFDAPETEGVINGGAKAGRDFSDARVNPDINVFDALGDHVQALEKEGKRAFIGAFSEGTRDRLMTVMGEHGLEPLALIDSWTAAQGLAKGVIGVAVLGLERGFVTADICVISEQDILGERLSRPGKRKISAENFIADVTTLSEGDMVVHIEHGIAQYAGLVTLDVGGAAHDCLKLIYAGQDKLFLPVENIDVITRYGSEDAGAQLDKLGGAAWQARRAGLKERLKDMAEELIKIAAARELRTTERMIPDPGALDEFASRFAYTETEDQARAIRSVVADLGEGRPTDRLVCGDVGFGKTEVALRAAFVAALSGRQVALVVPTTLLARQHFKNFQERFKGFPVRIAQLSRLVSAKDMKANKDAMKSGDVDIVIGTHALLAKDIGFRDLGLLIIDEEQHFGVKHKEQLKALKADVHVLTLTATPIPRTLQLALTGVREMSLIATPPVDRLAVRTFVTPFDPVVVREAIIRERFRGGQTFYVCPRIQDQAFLKKQLKELVPEVSVAVVNGQMPASDLEDVISDFYDAKYDVLLSTNIIESGLDLPSVNTILIHRADMFGLAQLYQLRGRVGRSKTRAYAYLTLPPGKKLTPTAQKRLTVMQTLDTLGAGFQLASHDLDIRGAGNLLGEEQSGHIREVGVELYQHMLEEAVAEARGEISGEGAPAEEYSPQVSLGIPVLIPESYVLDLNLRMELYRRVSRLTSDPESEAFAAELIDRFGKLPGEVENLLNIVSVKRMCKRAHIDKIDSGPKGAVLSFHNNTFPNPGGLIRYITDQVGTVNLRPDHKLVIKRAWNSESDRLKGVITLVRTLADIAEAEA
ncbi:transcription-repair coupling factor [Magnetovibrio blakemorei]|uniref:Transcription-repair-coupling factor n=1 Tax=Magnetovibrio blakemorei TaxID=28181 RepID=A0A1E5Q787_9PROT|nr:transcription-repair coupling factor [Magnetovibrio blakemorei]OEJ66860.1 transcription-repair coupling factor [Magnetovibrio blakemorei]